MNVRRIALAGNPNCGKTALFNALTGGRQKVGNYAGVTVERKEGRFELSDGTAVLLTDLPGSYRLSASTPDEAVLVNELTQKGEAAPEGLIAVADAANLERSLSLVLEMRALGVPMVLALNMMDLARARGLRIDLEKFSSELRMPVIPTSAVKGEGLGELRRALENLPQATESKSDSKLTPQARFAEIDRILRVAVSRSPKQSKVTERIDRLVLHPIWGLVIFFLIVVTIFQSVFSWATLPQEQLEALVQSLASFVESQLVDGPLRSLLVDGVLSGVGSVIVFLPQILLLFLFILLLEDSGYMARAAFLMDRAMGRVGLNGRAFIPLLSSFACAIPGIMATRTIAHPRDRLVTILIAPLMTCSARLPVYTLLIAAFIPSRSVLGFNLQGLVMAALYFAGVLAALIAALVFRKTLLRGAAPAFVLELPTYKRPSLRSVWIGLTERAWIFLRRAGTVILSLSIVLWFAVSYPKAPVGFEGPAILASFAGRLGHALEPLFAPLGFNWEIVVALIPGFAAREVMVSALATVYAVGEGSTQDLGAILASRWSLPTALSLLVWYVIACQCISTLAVVKRETQSWKWPLFLLGYLTVAAYLASFATYQIARMVFE